MDNKNIILFVISFFCFLNTNCMVQYVWQNVVYLCPREKLKGQEVALQLSYTVFNKNMSLDQKKKELLKFKGKPEYVNCIFCNTMLKDKDIDDGLLEFFVKELRADVNSVDDIAKKSVLFYLCQKPNTKIDRVFFLIKKWSKL